VIFEKRIIFFTHYIILKMGLSNTSFGSLELSAKGLISRENVRAKIVPNLEKGIRFFLVSKEAELSSVSSEELLLEPVLADVSNISSTQRNTVLSNGKDYICLTEHFLAACALAGVNNLDVYLDQEELPFADGSATLWMELFQKNALVKEGTRHSSIDLKEQIYIEDPNNSLKFIKAIPVNGDFSATYQMDWNHPKIGKKSYTWALNHDPIEAVSQARTFSTEAENQMLGLSGWIIGITEDDFTLPLHFPDEPVRHKVLDLIGDLYLSGINPLEFKMQIISNQGGHYLNSLLAQELAKYR